MNRIPEINEVGNPGESLNSYEWAVFVNLGGTASFRPLNFQGAFLALI